MIILLLGCAVTLTADGHTYVLSAGFWSCVFILFFAAMVVSAFASLAQWLGGPPVRRERPKGPRADVGML